MSDTKPSQRAVGPEYHDTTEMPAVRVSGNTLEAVLLELRALRSEQSDTRKELKADIQLVSSELKIVQGRTKLVEDRLEHLEKASDSTKTHAKANTENDLKQDAAIASVIVRLDAVEQNQKDAAQERAATAKNVQDIRNAVVKTATGLAAFFDHPKVNLVGKAIFVLAAGYLAGKGIKVLP